MAIFRADQNEILSVQQALDCMAFGNHIDSINYTAIDSLRPGEQDPAETCSKGGQASLVFEALTDGYHNLVSEDLLPYSC